MVPVERGVWVAESDAFTTSRNWFIQHLHLVAVAGADGASVGFPGIP